MPIGGILGVLVMIGILAVIFFNPKLLFTVVFVGSFIGLVGLICAAGFLIGQEIEDSIRRWFH